MRILTCDDAHKQVYNSDAAPLVTLQGGMVSCIACSNIPRFRCCFYAPDFKILMTKEGLQRVSADAFSFTAGHLFSATWFILLEDQLNQLGTA